MLECPACGEVYYQFDGLVFKMHGKYWHHKTKEVAPGTLNTVICGPMIKRPLESN